MSGRVRPGGGAADSAKAGPMRATLPVSSVLKAPGAGTGTATPALRKSCGNSPTLSPTSAWRRVSPDHALSGQRSPGAANYKGKGRYGSNVIRRTASLDTLYHKGQWPRDLYLHAGHLQVDKATQTEEGGGWSGGGGAGSGRSSRASDEDKLERFLRSRLQRTPHKNSTEHSCQTTGVPFWSRYGSGGGVPLRAARSSVEGLNQEIERLVLFPASGTQTPHLDRLRDKVTPEGHRAPLAEMLRRSVNTQTPHDLCYTAHSSGPPSRASLSSGGSPEFGVAGPPSRASLSSGGSPEFGVAGGSVCSSPDLDGSRLGTSPHINRFLAREPPDGCEKVNLKAKESPGGAWSDDARAGPPCVSAPSAPAFQLRPSLTSAFQPLQPSDHR